jgi:hypothetical protein
MAAFVDVLLLLLLAFQKNVCFQTQTQTHCGMDLKGFGLGWVCRVHATTKDVPSPFCFR